MSSNENLLTIQQQLERLQREVSDLSKSVFSNNNNNSNDDDTLVTNLSAIDMRIYDLEKDVKKLNGDLEEIFFQIEDIFEEVKSFEETLKNLDSKILTLNQNSLANQNNIDKSINNNEVLKDENTLGELKISNNENNQSQNTLVEESSSDLNNKNLSPEDQFQIAFDNIREKKWDDAKKLFKDFISDNPENQLSGSAYYWLGKLYIFENNHREAVITLAEGHQLFPESIKAPEMLFDLSQSLLVINKVEESCNIMKILLDNYPKNKSANKTKKQILDSGCIVSEE